MYLQPRPRVLFFLAKLPEPELKRALVAEIEAALSGGLETVTQEHLDEISEALRPTFEVLPKNSYDRLNHNSVRYLMNRYFSTRHGWFINGLQEGGESWNASSAKISMRDHIPEVLQELFEKRIGQRGSGLKEVSVFAAMTEHLIHEELRSKLELVYQSKGVLAGASIERPQAVKIMELYVICMLRGHDTAACVRQSKVLESTFHKQYPAWKEVQQMIADIVPTSADEQPSFLFGDIANLLGVVTKRFAQFYEGQCSKLKSSLLSMEEKHSGRARLTDFYKAALYDGMYNFVETIEVLRHLGSLDEVNASNPRIIIPNYVQGLSNCVARTSFYSTCCPNTCEALLDRVERALGKSEATPTEIVTAIEDPTAALEPGFQGLNPWLRKRLDNLARHHGGNVPLHGRLFMQWMHFVHPRDCAYPHLSGTTYKRTLEEWARDHSSSPQLTVQQLTSVTKHLDQIASGSDGPQQAERSRVDEDVHGADHHDEPDHISRMWTMEEELLTTQSSWLHASVGGRRSKLAELAAYVAAPLLVALAGCMLMPGPRKPHKSALYKASIPKYTV
jgi:hypothetical protein